MSALDAGLTIGPMAAEMAVCAPLAGRMIARRGARIPIISAGIALAASSAALSRLTGLSSEAFLSVTYSLFGVGAGLLSPAVTYGVMSSVPDGQAGVASGMNSSSRQLGQCLGIAVTGTVLDGSLHGSMQSGFLPAARGSWLIMAGCGLLVLVAGMAGNSRRTDQPRGRHARPPGSRRDPSLTGPGGLWGCETTRGKAGVEFLAKHVQGPASECRNLSPRIGPV